MNNNAKGANAHGNKGFAKTNAAEKNLNDSIVLDYPGAISKTFFDAKKILAPENVQKLATATEIQRIIDEQTMQDLSTLEYYMQNPDGFRNMVIEFLHAYRHIKEMWESDGTRHNFVKHLFISFCNKNDATISPVGTKANTDQPFCCITNMLALSRSEVERVNEQFLEEYKKWESEHPGKPVPSKLFKFAWVISNTDIAAMYSMKSDKTLSFTAYRALNKLFFDLGEQDDKEVMNIVRHFVREDTHERFMASLNDETREEYKKTKEAEMKHRVSRPKNTASETMENVSGADKLLALRKQLEKDFEQTEKDCQQTEKDCEKI